MKKIFCIPLIVILSFLPVLGQMPGWMTIHDGDGNVYFVDQALKIRTDVNSGILYKAVKKESADYYLELARQQYAEHHKIEALTLLKSIRILSDKTGSIYKTAEKATFEIDKIRKLEGDRFHKLDVDSSIQMYTLDNKQCMSSSFGGFEFCTSGTINVLKKSALEKYNYSRDGVLVSVSSSADSKNAFCLISITSEKFHYTITSIKDYEEIIRNKNGTDAYERNLIKQTQHLKLSGIKYQGDMVFLGYEFFKIDDKYGLYMKLIYPENQNDNFGPEIENIMKDLSGIKF
ncbi:MAG: hypothetical protein JW982_03245 [Spirochaetes bacterium]|nr:hypothetical protein [Spirochaetota bacterium]